MDSNRSPLSQGADAVADQVRQWRDRLHQTRDELRLKAHLAGRELADRREALERERADLEARVDKAKEKASDGASRVGADLRAAWTETLATFEDLKRELSSRE